MEQFSYTLFDKKALGQDGDGIKTKMKKKSFRSSIDITFWNKEGHSAFGLKRHQAKFVATGFIIFSLLLMNPPTIPFPDDIINIYMARSIVEHTLLDLMYNLPSMMGLKKVVIDENVIKESGEPFFIYEGKKASKVANK